jgi:protein-tyrosine-phosphatase
MPDPGHILVVCTGNICRSPMGAALLQHALAGQKEPLRSLKVYSAGVASRSGEPASANAVTALKKVGIELKGHQSQPVTQELLDKAILVLCMTESHRDMIEITAQPVPERLYLFKELMGNRADLEISDPYGMHLSAYEASRDDMVAAIPSIVDYLAKLPASAFAGA